LIGSDKLGIDKMSSKNQKSKCFYTYYICYCFGLIKQTICKSF